jgi:hypothetical protein
MILQSTIRNNVTTNLLAYHELENFSVVSFEPFFNMFLFRPFWLAVSGRIGSSECHI